jgi:5-methylcytosine-specific restriction endonuclease McrA
MDADACNPGDVGRCGAVRPQSAEITCNPPKADAMRPFPTSEVTAWPMTPREYRNYLRSADFRERIRKPALARAKGVCENCGREGRLSIHHRTYYLVGTPMELASVEVICGRCHLKVHHR